ncbi:unnamed protein product [Oppiella nova]|uniref:Rap GTPase-activating protein n=1 Tax=Oppiella nova TaxID=334625 RepID=A0A7R9L9A6_9ACAR|nr:unnamed protein product [Oppiella nova]CAG2159594.1 unnamed protein product [Oppiella nova]
MSSICFICELPILSHQTWDTWTQPQALGCQQDLANIYHEDCLNCCVCVARIKQGNGSAKRHGNKVYCVLHYGDICGLTGGEDFMGKLKDFKRQSLGCAEARRKSSTTLSFPVPVQACPGSPYCSGFPHDVKPTAGYWIECKGGTDFANRDNETEHEIDLKTRKESITLMTGDLSSYKPQPPTPTVEVVLTRPRFERQDSTKSTNDDYFSQDSYNFLQVESQRPKTKDDIELYRKPFVPPVTPNITITIVQPTSPPASPPAPSPPPPSSQSNSNQPQTKESDDPYELISFEEEIFEKHYYGREHWNYFTNDEALGPVILSLKQEMLGNRDQFRILLRTISYSMHGLVPASAIFADRYDREAVVRALGNEAGLKPPLALGQLPSTSDELLKLDQVFIKSELKVGVIYIKANQVNSEEMILSNKTESHLFAEFLGILGDRIRLKGFDKYKGGLDTVHDLTGTESVYTAFKNIEIMFHVSTMLPHEESDPQKLQKKRHIGNDIVCVAFLEAEEAPFWPGCIKSHFLHTFIVVRTSPKPIEAGETRKYSVSVVCRDEVSAFKPYLWHESEFEKGSHFREWLLTKIINGERASYSAPKFARMQDRTRSQMLEDIVNNLANHLATGQIPKPYRRGSWRPIGHMRPSSPLLDSVRDLFEGYDQIAKDFNNAFYGNAKLLCDVVFNVMGSPVNGGHENQVRRIYAVRAILAIRSRVFLEMLYGFAPPRGQTGAEGQIVAHTTSISTTITTTGGAQQTNNQEKKVKKRDSITEQAKNAITQVLIPPKIIAPNADKDKEKKKEKDIRKASSASTMSTAPPAQKTPTYLTVPGASGGGVFKTFKTFMSGSWSGWGSKGRNDSMKRWQSESFYAKLESTGVEVPGLSVCADVAKIDRTKLAQNEFTIIEFDGDTFQLLIEYLHSGSCPITCDTVPGLICAAEHFDLPDLLQACFHHTKTHLKLNVVPRMLNQLENYYWRYTSASQLVNTILNYVDPRANALFARQEYLQLSESMLQTILTRQNVNLSETKKFQVMFQWSVHKVKTDRLADRPQNDKLQTTRVNELQAIMNRMTRDLKLHKIPPQDLIKIVLPSKTISHERILATLLYQADSGIYRNSEFGN